MKNKNESIIISLDILNINVREKMFFNNTNDAEYKQPHSIVREQLQKNNENNSTTDVEEEPTTIKRGEVVCGILEGNDYLFRVNKNGYGYRLSYKDKINPLCFVSVKKDELERIIVARKDLTEEQLEDAYNVFSNVHGYFKTKLKMECNHK